MLTATKSPIKYLTADVKGHNIFYREAGQPKNPTVLLLHGFPTSSHMFRNLIPHLSDRFHVVAPDFPGFGFTQSPEKFTYTFDNIAKTIADFTEVIGLKKFAIYIFDYGAPVGLRLALWQPDKISAIVTQNGNAYEEGLSKQGWDPIQKYWEEPSKARRDALREFLTLESVKWQYTFGVPDESLVAPEGYTLDAELMKRPGNYEIQLDLFLDYANNVKLYPKFQEYFRAHKPPLLAIWGKNDPFFLPEGAKAYARDIPQAKIQFLDTGHFALETHAQEIGQAILGFL